MPDAENMQRSLLKMQKKNLFLLALALPVSWLSAALPPEVAVSSDVTYSSRYLFRGVKRASDSIQPNVEAGMGDYYAGLWANLPTGRAGSEIQYYGGRSLPLPTVEFAALDFGATFYDYPQSGVNRTHEFFVGAQVRAPRLPSLSGSLYYFHDVDLRSRVAEASAVYAVSLERWGLPSSLDLSLVGGLQGGHAGKSESYHYYGGAIELPFALNDYAAVTVGLHYQTAEKRSFRAGERNRSLYSSVSYSAWF